MSRRSPAVVACAVMQLLAASAASAATLKGRIVNGTTGGPGVAERVELIDVTRGMTVLQSLENVSGSFEMPDAPDAASAHFLLRLTYDGITSTQLVDGFDEEFEVAVFESTDEIEGVRISRHHAVFAKDPDHYQITEFLEYDNASDPPRAIRASALAMRLHLDHDVHGEIEASVGTGSMPVRTTLRPTDQTKVLGADHALPPGKTRLIVRYLVHYTDADYVWRTETVLPSEERRVLVTPKDITVRSQDMIPTDAGIEDYAAWAGLAASPGEAWEVTLAGGSTLAAAGQTGGERGSDGNRDTGSRTAQQDVVDVVARPNRLEARRWDITLGLATLLLFATLAGLASSRRPQASAEPDAQKVSISKLADQYVAGVISKEQFESERDRVLQGKPKRKKGDAPVAGSRA